MKFPETIIVRVRKGKKDAIKKDAKRAKMDISDYIRQLLEQPIK